MGAVYNDLTQVKNIPIDYLRLSMGGAGQWDFKNLEDGSSLDFSCLTDQNDTGGETVTGYKIEINAIVLQNNYEDILDALRAAVSSTGTTDCDVICQCLTGEDNAAQLWITMDNSSVDVKNWHTTYSINHSQHFPRLTLKVKGIFSIDAIQTGGGGEEFFKQMTGY